MGHFIFQETFEGKKKKNPQIIKNLEKNQNMKNLKTFFIIVTVRNTTGIWW